MPLWDPVIQEPAKRFLDSLPPEERRHCEDVIWQDLCRTPDLRGVAGPQGERHRLIKGWHFRYKILNANAFNITGIFYSILNPKHPIFGQDVDLP